eukprot:COSAG02_NODE_85_length_39411_cov_50.018493_20_plen_63_part_00
MLYCVEWLSFVLEQVPHVVERAAVAWFDADWPAELGSMPLGNGDVSANGACECVHAELLALC